MYSVDGYIRCIRLVGAFGVFGWIHSMYSVGGYIQCIRLDTLGVFGWWICSFDRFFLAGRVCGRMWRLCVFGGC